MMLRTSVLILFAAAVAFGQSETDHVFVTAGAIGGGFRTMSASAVQGAPYSANVINESVQTLADGNRIVQSSTGTTARDSMGRTRQDAPLPAIGNMSPAKEPHLVFLQDPVAQTSYTLNVTDKTAMKGPSFNGGSAGVSKRIATVDIKGLAAVGPMTVAAGGPPPPLAAAPMITFQRTEIMADASNAKTEDLGSQTMEGVMVTGTRTTRTIPAGQIGNDRPIEIVTEVWTSPELKTVVYSKRGDPRIGDQTFKLTNIIRSQPDPSLFIVPADFKVIEGAEPIVYKTSGVPAR